MAKQKRINPRRVPMPKDSAIAEQIIERASRGNSVYAWILVLHSMLYHVAESDEERLRAWNVADSVRVRESLDLKSIHDAESIMGLRLPHPNLAKKQIASLGDAVTYERKAKENALFFGLCAIALGLQAANAYDSAQLRRIFANADLTFAEIEHGSTTYEELAKEIEESGQELGWTSSINMSL